MNAALEAFTTELKAQGVWDDVTIVGVSEFGRTLTMNSGKRIFVAFMNSHSFSSFSHYFLGRNLIILLHSKRQ